MLDRRTEVFPSLVSYTLNELLVYAEVEPSGYRWLPWPGRTSRWWFEVMHKHDPDEHGCDTTTHAYLEYGRGGAFTLRRCLIRASEAIEVAVEELEKEAGISWNITQIGA